MLTDNEVNIEVVKILREAGLTAHQGTVSPALPMLRAVWRSFEAPDKNVPCPHWEPGTITMRVGCTACQADAEAAYLRATGSTPPPDWSPWKASK